MMNLFQKKNRELSVEEGECFVRVCVRKKSIPLTF